MKIKELSVFFLLAYAISWLLWSPLWLPYFGVEAAPFLPYQHGFGGLGPMLAAFAATAIFGGKAAVQKLWWSLFQWKPVSWMGVAVFSPLVLALLGGVLAWFADGRFPDFSGLGRSSEFPELGIGGFVFYNLIAFGYGEEVGWRGFALPRLQEKHAPLVATLILSVLWAGWHLPVFAYRPGYVAMDFGGAVGWFFSILAGAVLFTWLFNGSKGSILACAVFHGMIDVVFLADYGNAAMMQHIGMLVTFWGIAAAVVLWRRKT